MQLRTNRKDSFGGRFFRFFAVLVPTLFDLAGEIRAAGSELRGKLGSDAGNLTKEDRDLFFASGPLGDFDSLGSRESFAVEDAAEDAELSELLFLGDFNDFFGERNDIGSAPADGGISGDTFESGFERSTGDGARREAVLNDHDADVFFGEDGAELVAVVDLHTYQIDEKSVLNAAEALLQLFGNNILNKLTHCTSFRLLRADVGKSTDAQRHCKETRRPGLIVAEIAIDLT